MQEAAQALAGDAVAGACDAEISVVTPTRDRPELLLRAARSLLSQGVPNWEWIVVDDGSCVAPALPDLGTRLRTIHLGKSGGAAAARNRGIEAARAAVIAFLDDDDEYEPDYIESVLRGFSRHADASFCMTGVTRVFADASTRREPFDVDDRSREFLRRASTSRGFAMRASILRSLGGFDASLGVSEDVDLMMRAAAAGARPFFLREPLVRVHEHAGASLSRSSTLEVHARASELLWRRHQPLLRANRALWRHYGGVHAANLYRAGRRAEARALLRELSSHLDAIPRALEIWFRFERRAENAAVQSR